MESNKINPKFNKYQNLRKNLLVFVAFESSNAIPLRCEPLGTLNGIVKNFCLPKSRSSTFSFSIAELVRSILLIFFEDYYDPEN